MASGILGQSAPTASVVTTVYTVPASKVATFNVNVVNRSTGSISVRLAISSSQNPATQEWIEYGAVLPAGGVLERTGLVAQAGKNLVVYCSSAETSVSVYGFEE